MCSAGVKPVPDLTSTAVPPEPMVPAVWCARFMQGFQPFARAVFVAVVRVLSVCSLCSCRKSTSAEERARQLPMADAQELGFHVSNAQMPFLCHHLSSLTDATSSKMGSGTRAQESP